MSLITIYTLGSNTAIGEAWIVSTRRAINSITGYTFRKPITGWKPVYLLSDYVLTSLVSTVQSALAYYTAAVIVQYQGCSLGLERLGLVSVSRVWKNRTSRSCLGLEDIMSRLGLVTLVL